MRFHALPSILTLGILVPLLAQANPYQPSSTAAPNNYREAAQGIRELRENIDSVQCGGWQANALQQGSNENDIPIPTVTGVPGKANLNAGYDKKTGAGLAGPFTFPSSGSAGNPDLPDPANDNTGAWGYQSACDITRERDDYQNPINPNHLCMKYTASDGTVQDNRTPEKCRQLYQFLRAQASNSSLNRPATCGIPARLCFDDVQPPLATQDNPRADECAGETPPQGCKDPGPPTFAYELPSCHSSSTSNGLVTVVDSQGEVTANKKPFYRHYDTEVTAPDEPPGSQWLLYSRCYGYYSTIDPQTTVTQETDDQCEIVFSDMSSNVAPTTPEWKTASSQKGQYKPNPPFEGQNDNWPPEPRTSASANPWVLDTETSISLLDMAAVAQINQGGLDPNDIKPFSDVSNIPIKQRASKQEPIHYLDAFDDKGTREVSKWWEKQQRALLPLLKQPTLRLTMPSRVLAGLEADDPLIRLMQSRVTKSNGLVEVAIHSGPDELSAALASLSQSFILPVRLVKIPILVPLASETEIASRIAEWRLWMVQHSADANVNAAVPLIAKLESYRFAARRVRELRSALPQSLQQALRVQQQVRQFYATWYLRNAERLLAWAQVSTQRQELSRTWKQISTSMLHMVECERQWCSNQRYSIPIYSLLDNWYRPNPPPDLSTLSYELPKDYSVKFAGVGLPQEYLSIPVLSVTQAKLKLPLPPTGILMPNIADYPDLPPLPDLAILTNFTVPSVQFPPDVTVLPDLNVPGGLRFVFGQTYLIPASTQNTDALTSAQERLSAIKTMIDGQGREGMRGRTCTFSKSVTASSEPRSQKIVIVENELKQSIARLFARYAPQRTADVRGRELRMNADYPSPQSQPLCAQAGFCLPLSGEIIRSFGWQWYSPFLLPNFTAAALALQNATLPTTELLNPYAQSSLETLQRIFPALPPPISIILHL